VGDDQSQTGRRRLTVAEASEILGITVEAVRGRIKRGTLEHERDSGTVYVLLDADQPSTSHQPDDNRMQPDAPAAVTEELRDRVRYLERQVEEEREARRRADTILAQLSAANAEQARTIRALEAPQEAPGAPDTAEEESERAEPRSGTGDTEVATEEPSEAEPSLLLERVTVVILSTLPLLYLFLADVVHILPASPAFGPSWVALVAAMVLAGVVFPAVFGLRLGHKVSRLRFWRNVAPVAALILLVGLIGEFVVATSFLFYVIPSLVYSFAAILGNALRRRTREKLMEERPSDFPQEAATSGQRWTPRQQAIVGLAGRSSRPSSGWLAPYLR
jgi:hypothetical protein